MRTLVKAVTVLCVVILAGCLGGGDSQGGEPTDGKTPDPATTPAPTPTPDPGAQPGQDNTPPTISFSANITAGPAPLDVLFALDAIDFEDDPLSWTLDVTGDGVPEADGTSLPHEFRYTYTSDGQFNATMTVSDGNRNATETLTINVARPVAIEPPPEPVVFTGHAYVPDPIFIVQGECLLPLLQSVGMPTGNIMGAHHNLASEHGGWNYVLEPESFTPVFLKGAGYVGGRTNTGQIPEGAEAVEVCSNAAVDEDYTFTMTHPDYVAPE